MEVSMSMPVSLTGAVGSRRPHIFTEMFSNRGRPNDYLCNFPMLISRRNNPPSQTTSMVLSGNHLKVLAHHRNQVPTIEARSIDEIYDTLAEHVFQTIETEWDPDMKYIIGLAGSPGAGKSTIASEVVRRLNMAWPHKLSEKNCQENSCDIAIALPMDGFHLYRSQLDAMENPKEAHARRGAPWTFDPLLLLKCLQDLRIQGEASFPSFDHGIGDPVEHDIHVNQHHKVVIVEGNYILLENGVWKEISSIFNEKWFIEIDINKAMQRVLKRHISTGKSPDAAKWRIEYNDRPNSELILKSKKNADIVIKSVDMNH